MRDKQKANDNNVMMDLHFFRCVVRFRGRRGGEWKVKRNCIIYYKHAKAFLIKIFI